MSPRRVSGSTRRPPGSSSRCRTTRLVADGKRKDLGVVDPGVLALLIVLLVVAVVGTVWRRRQGMLRERRSDAAVPAEVLAGLGVSLGDRGTLVQFSSAFCQPCRATRQVLAAVARSAPDVTHVDV